MVAIMIKASSFVIYMESMKSNMKSINSIIKSHHVLMHQ